MSFYVGRHRVGAVTKRQLHITAHEQGIDYMRGGVQDDTVFHTDVKYLGYSIHTVSPRSQYYVYGGNSQCNNTIGGGFTFSTTQALVDAAAGGYSIIVARKDGTQYIPYLGISVQWTDGSAFRCTDYVDPVYQLYNVVSSASNAYNIPFIGNYFSQSDIGSLGSLYFIVMDFSISGAVRDVFYPSTNEIILSSNRIDINGIDLLNAKYITEHKYNVIDNTVTIGSKFIQLINSVPATGGLSIKSKANSGTQIYAGSKKIIDSTFGSHGIRIKNFGVSTYPEQTFVVGAQSGWKVVPVYSYSGMSVVSVNVWGLTKTFILNDTVSKNDNTDTVYRDLRLLRDNQGHYYYKRLYFRIVNGSIYLLYLVDGSVLSGESFRYGDTITVRYVQF